MLIKTLSLKLLESKEKCEVATFFDGITSAVKIRGTKVERSDLMKEIYLLEDTFKNNCSVFIDI